MPSAKSSSVQSEFGKDTASNFEYARTRLASSRGHHLECLFGRGRWLDTESSPRPPCWERQHGTQQQRPSAPPNNHAGGVTNRAGDVLNVDRKLFGLLPVRFLFSECLRKIRKLPGNIAPHKSEILHYCDEANRVGLCNCPGSVQTCLSRLIPWNSLPAQKSN